MFNRRNTLAALAATAFAATAPLASAQPVLDKQVKIIVGFPIEDGRLRDAEDVFAAMDKDDLA